MSSGSRYRLIGLLAATAAAVVLGTTPTATPAAASGGCAQDQIYVSPSGNDHNSGTKAKPFKTVQHARDTVSQRGLNKAGKMRCDVVVNLRAGDYPVDQTITFNEKDSGNNGHQVIYRSYDGPGKARLLGAKPITGWQQYQGDIYRTQVDPSHPFYTLFEDGQRATTARYPNRAEDDKWAPYLTTALNTDYLNSQTWLTYNPGDWNPDWDMHDAQVVIWSGGHWSWFTDTDPVLDVSWNKGLATLKYPTRYSIETEDPGSRYFLQNSLSFLDSPGEYYLDSQTGWLYYWPRTGNINDTTIMAPTVSTILSIAGSSESQRVHDLTFDGIALQYSDFMDWYRDGFNYAGDSGVDHKYPEYDRQIEMPRNRFGMVTMTNTHDVNLKSMDISDSGYTAVYMLFANDHDSVTDSLLEHLGADGIKVEGPYPGEGDVANHNTFTDNYINNYGELVPGDASGVEIMDSGNNLISNSVIEHSARYAVTLETLTTAANADNYTHDNTLQYLKVSDVGLDSGDMGAIYAYGVQDFEPHTIVNHMSQITIDNVNADPSMPDTPPSGVHMDGGGCGFDFSDIQVTNVEYKPYHGDTSCNTFENDSWNAGFDPSQMQLDKIGVTSAYPYAPPQ
ncbi:hypothetical protein GCM10023322_44030 [Rugosimonospora acidiphila]|uniref:Right handed beta helix region n=1 Tax=Rugosimonospora acidiphila TaxID=556531 RepID=A0ABP9S0W1_9ACTN